MRFGLLSDVHLEFRNLNLKEAQLPDVDCMLLAGDIGPGRSGMKWADRTFASKGVHTIYVAGNHEFYTRKRYHEVMEGLRAWHSPETGLVYLQDEVWEFPEHNVAVIGSTLWTDFKLNGNPVMDMMRMEAGAMNDLLWTDRTAEGLRRENLNSALFIQQKVEYYKNMGWKTLVMSHHAPTVLSCDDKYAGNVDNVFFANTFDLKLDFVWPDVWVHGHMHNKSEYEIGGCRVYANPRGYNDHENPEFDSSFVIEL